MRGLSGAFTAPDNFCTPFNLSTRERRTDRVYTTSSPETCWGRSSTMNVRGRKREHEGEGGRGFMREDTLQFGIALDSLYIQKFRRSSRNCNIILYPSASSRRPLVFPFLSPQSRCNSQEEYRKSIGICVSDASKPRMNNCLLQMIEDWHRDIQCIHTRVRVLYILHFFPVGRYKKNNWRRATP